jgi:hypothetical protein
MMKIFGPKIRTRLECKDNVKLEKVVCDMKRYELEKKAKNEPKERV